MAGREKDIVTCLASIGSFVAVSDACSCQLPHRRVTICIWPYISLLHWPYLSVLQSPSLSSVSTLCSPVLSYGSSSSHTNSIHSTQGYSLYLLPFSPMNQTTVSHHLIHSTILSFTFKACLIFLTQFRCFHYPSHSDHKHLLASGILHRISCNLESEG